MALPENLGTVAAMIFSTTGAVVIAILVVLLIQAKGRLAQSEVRVGELEEKDSRLKSELEKAEKDVNYAVRKARELDERFDGVRASINGASIGGSERGR